jgi:uncharacterized membrane protein YbhN (UPF0104 family)
MVLAWCVGFGLLAWLLSRAPLSDVAQALSRPSPWTWLLTLAGLLTSYGLRAARLQIVLNLDGHRQAPRRWLGLRTDALRVILMHNAAVNLLPMRAGELSFPWLASRELGMPVTRAVACLLWMRVQDLLVLAGLGVMLWPGLPGWLRGLALAMGMLGWWGLSLFSRRWFARHASAPANATSKVALWMGRLRVALLEREHHHPLAWLATLSNWALKLAAGAYLLSAITGAPWAAGWTGALGGELAAIVPLQGPAGFGTYEAGVWAGMATQLTPGASALGHAVGAALALHVCFLLCAVAAGLMAAALGKVRSPQATPGSPSSRHPG